MAFSECWSRSVYIPTTPDYTELVEPIAGLKMCVRAHLCLGMHQRIRYFADRQKSACSRFRGDAELGYFGSPTKRPRARSSYIVR